VHFESAPDDRGVTNLFLGAATRGALLAEPSGWPRLLSRSSFPEPCLPRTALTDRVLRSNTWRAGLLRWLHTILAPAPDALVLADASPAAIPALASPALVLAAAAILALAPDALVLADASLAAILARAGARKGPTCRNPGTGSGSQKADPPQSLHRLLCLRAASIVFSVNGRGL